MHGNFWNIYIEILAERKTHLLGVTRNEDTKKNPTDRGSYLAGFKRRREG